MACEANPEVSVQLINWERTEADRAISKIIVVFALSRSFSVCDVRTGRPTPDGTGDHDSGILLIFHTYIFGQKYLAPLPKVD